MKAFLQWPRFASLAFCWVLIAGCATTPKVDWDSRIGNFTYDEAVLELGPPDKMATLEDGTKVAEWRLSRGMSTSFGVYSRVGPFIDVVQPSSYGPERWLRLTFSPDDKLTSWRRFIR